MIERLVLSVEGMPAMNWVTISMIFFADIFDKVRKLVNPPSFSVSWDERTRGQLFFYYYPKRWLLSWENIATVYGRKVDMICYEENPFFFEDREGKWFCVGELDKGFSNLEREIFRRYPDIREGWMAELEMDPAEIDFLLWPRKRSEPSIRKTVINERARSRRFASQRPLQKRD